MFIRGLRRLQDLLHDPSVAIALNGHFWVSPPEACSARTRAALNSIRQQPLQDFGGSLCCLILWGHRRVYNEYVSIYIYMYMHIYAYYIYIYTCFHIHTYMHTHVSQDARQVQAKSNICQLGARDSHFLCETFAEIR